MRCPQWSPRWAMDIDTAEIRRQLEWATQASNVEHASALATVTLLCEEIDRLRSEIDRSISVQRALERDLAHERRKVAANEQLRREQQRARRNELPA